MAEGTQQASDMWQYRPGEVVVAVHLPDDPAQHPPAHGRVAEAIQQQLAGSTGGVVGPSHQQPEPIVFRAPGRPPLGFLFYDLEQQTHQPVKEVVNGLHRNGGADLATSLERVGISPVGVMPHWLASCQPWHQDGSPASVPGPARPPGEGRWRYRYTARQADLNTRARAAELPDSAQVPVLVLDTAPRWSHARQQAERFAASNAALAEVFERLSEHPLQEWHRQAARQMRDDGLALAPSPDGREQNYDMSDHGLFVAGLIHDLAPHADLRLRPVLNPRGVGNLHLLLRVLADEVAGKDPRAPLAINMSLGFGPKLEHLAWMWYGVSRPNDPDFWPDAPTAGAADAHDRPWLAGQRDEVSRTLYQLHSGVDHLMRYLLANNCLGIAAAGNDSRRRAETGEPRFGPRLPARYESVLGVAATRGEPDQAASYSNAGDELEYGDHIATFGGEVDASNQPHPGAIGVYTAATYPGGQDNTTGWAAWSGTSFATAIAAGVVAGYWAEQREADPGTSAESILLRFNQLAGSYAPALRTPSFAVDGAWERA